MTEDARDDLNAAQPTEPPPVGASRCRRAAARSLRRPRRSR